MKLPTLNFPTCGFRTKTEGKQTIIFDCIRKKYVALTPEEWVRQHLIHYLVAEKEYPATLISIEAQLRYVGVDKRSDMLIYSRKSSPLMLVECKAPEIALTQKVFEQIATYNLAIQAPCLMITNGILHYCFTAAIDDTPARFLKEVPNYEELTALEKRL